MTLKQLMDRLLAICPDALFDEDGEGQVIVYAGCLVHPEEDWLVGDMPLRAID